MFEHLAEGIPLTDAAHYFIGLKNFEKTADESNVASSEYAPPDQTGQLEGQFAVPVERVLEHMAKMVQNELKTQYSYMVYANSLRDFAHHSIAEEFEDHAHNETEHADFLLRRMAVLGGPIHVPDIPAPPAATDPADIIQTMVRIEQEGIQNWRILRQMVGDENPMKFKIEEYLTREQEHLDELWQLLPHQENNAVLAQRAGSPMSADKVAAEKDAEMPGGLPAAAMGQHPMPSQPLPLTGPAAGQNTMAGKMAAAASKLAFVGVGIDVASFGESKDMKGVVNVGFPHVISVGGRHKPSGVGAGVGVTGPVVSWSPSTMAAHEKETEKSKKKRASADKDHVAAGRQRALTNAASGFEHDRHSRMERLGETIGRLSGAFLGAHEGSRLARGNKHQVAAALGAAAISSHVGAKTLKHLGRSSDRRRFEKKHASVDVLFKRALDELSGGVPDSPVEDLGEQPAVAPSFTPEVMAYLQAEQQGRAAEEVGQAAFYKQKFDQASQQLQQAQQAAEAQGQQMQQLQQQADQAGQMQQAALDRSTQVQQAALANATAAHAAATQAMQQSLSAQKDSITQSQLAVNMRDAVHALRQSVMETVQKELPPATVAESGAMQLDQTAAAQPPMGDTNAPPSPADPTAQATASPGADMTADQQPPPQEEAPKTANDKLVGAIMGGLAGGLGGYAESRMSNDPLRKKVKELSSGDHGFAGAMNLAQAKARLAVGELGEKHPMVPTLAAAGVGALNGAILAPHVRKFMKG